MKIFRIIFTFIILVSTVVPQDVSFVNGNIWRKMKQDNKVYYLTGFLDGLKKSSQIIDLSVQSAQRKEFSFVEPFYVNQMRENINAYFPERASVSTSTIIELLNAFYADKYNSKIKFEAAIRIVLARQKGDIGKADFWLEEARRSIFAK
ncbi:MAG: hypothetical protein COT43_08265 [Candidatus Marinimicrobia bacterium CG08_land_8_20_14_0_20_45_22]|nr:MAG: hypothetical protein COT43_08265 [Candidatus Marinimicrobia bacterium CG08_land_8_20_14_0_20_45_22]